MKKSKILLLFSLLVLIYTIYIIKNDIYKSKYKDEKIIYGYINSIKENQIELIGKEKIIVKTKNTNYKLGDYIKCYGKMNNVNHNTNFNLFDYNNYLKSKKIYHIFNANKIIKYKNNNKIRYKLKNKIKDRINNNYTYAFILGDTSLIDDNVKDTYRSNGISHLFAVSGMHITLFTTVLLFILSKTIKNKYIVNSIIFIFLIFYMFLTNFSPSVIRASFLFIILSFKKLFNKKISAIKALIIILDIMLLYNPYYIYNVGFILSFTVSGSLIIYNKIISRYKNYFISLFMVSLISFLISIPIIINNNNEINLLSPFINIIFVPYISLIIFPLSLLTFIFNFINPLLLLNIKIFENTSILFNSLNTKIVLKEINIYTFIMYYLIIIFILNKMKNKKYIYILIIFIVLFIHTNINYFRNYSKITFIDVNQGDSLLIELPKSKNILIDTGGRYNYDLTKNVLLPYLKSEGITKLDYLILTHGDYDHMGEAINLVNNFKVEKVIFNCGEFNKLENELIKVLDKKKIPYYKCIDRINNFYFLQTKEYDNENDNSNVIYTELNGYKFMFMGDAGVTTEKEIIDKYNLPDIDVLKVGHHGSKTSSGKKFINEISPKYSIISVGKNNRYGHPNKEVLDTLSNSKIYRTDQDGSIMFKLKNNKLKTRTFSQN